MYSTVNKRILEKVHVKNVGYSILINWENMGLKDVKFTFFIQYLF